MKETQINPNTDAPSISSGETAILFSLPYPSKVSVEIYDLDGSICGVIPGRILEPGDHQIEVNIIDFGISKGKYVYYLQIENKVGTSRECKTMTIG